MGNSVGKVEEGCYQSGSIRQLFKRKKGQQGPKEEQGNDVEDGPGATPTPEGKPEGMGGTPGSCSMGAVGRQYFDEWPVEEFAEFLAEAMMVVSQAGAGGLEARRAMDLRNRIPPGCP